MSETIDPCACFLYASDEAGGDCVCGHASDEHNVRGHHETECMSGHGPACPLDHGTRPCPPGSERVTTYEIHPDLALIDDFDGPDGSVPEGER